MKILGLGHYSRTGKDSLANSIRSYACAMGEIKVKKISFAWKLKQIAYELYGWAGLREPEFYDTKAGEGHRDLAVRAVGKTPIEIWCDLGMKMREICPSTWVDYVLQTDHDCDLLIIPDVRFPNEVKAVKEMGGRLVKVVREGYGPRDTDADQALVGWDGWDIVAGPTLKDLHLTAREIHEWAAGHCQFPSQTTAERNHLLELEEL